MKTPILLLHGALGSKAQFIPLQKILAKQHEVYSLNFDGHGNSKSGNDFSIDLFTRNVFEFLNEKKLSKIAVFGYSMGGYVAFNLALKHPGFIEKIITLGTKFDWNPEFAEKEIKMLNPQQMQLKVPAFVKQLQHLHGAENWKNVVEKTATMMLSLGNNPPLKKENFQQIEIETLLCLGEFDRMASISESENVANWLPNAIF